MTYLGWAHAVLTLHIERKSADIYKSFCRWDIVSVPARPVFLHQRWMAKLQSPSDRADTGHNVAWHYSKRKSSFSHSANLNGDKMIFSSTLLHFPNLISPDSETSRFMVVVMLKKMYPLFYSCLCITWQRHYTVWPLCRIGLKAWRSSWGPGLWASTRLWSQPRVAIQRTADFGTSALA